ncbi:molybdenum cofactor guanylyltransferase [Desulfoglaeba alkanexedens]|nr:molybdenum cofactor guanylyltransferase [Desulfoglaeba alkanexedens]
MISGAVLAGGQSRRFGRNKCLETFRGKRLIDRAVESLAESASLVLLVANELEPYLNVDARLVRDVIPRQGPLGGIYTALLFSPYPRVFVKAADMPFLEPRLARRLLTIDEKADVVVPVLEGEYEPLLAVYHARCIPLIARTLEEGERRIVGFYRRARVKRIEEEAWRPFDPDGRSFWNVNTAEDLERILAFEP